MSFSSSSTKSGVATVVAQTRIARRRAVVLAPSRAILTHRFITSSIAAAIIAMFGLTAGASVKTAGDGANDELSTSKRAFDALGTRGFGGFDKRAFDSFTGTGFNGLDKRSFDALNGRGFTSFDKRAPFDSLAGNGFNSFDKRSFDTFSNAGFGGFDKKKRAFDSFTGTGFNGLDKRSLDSIYGFY